MAQNNAKDILAAIVATLQAAPSLVPGTLKQIKTGIDADHDQGFPYCRVYLEGFSSPVADTFSYEREYRYAIEIWQEITQKAKATAESDFENAIHAVLNRLGGTWQLGIAVENTTVSAGGIRTAEVNGAPFRIATISLTVLTLIQNPA